MLLEETPAASSKPSPLTIFVQNRAYILPRKTLAGATLCEGKAEILNLILHRRIMAKLRYLLDKGELKAETAQAKAEELCAEDLRLSDACRAFGEDPVMAEALAIAREHITTQLAKENLPAPKHLDEHAKALIDAMPQILDRARLRLEARYRAAQQALGAL